MKKDELKGHLSMTTANMMWGLMSPISKMVLITSIITPFIIVEIRVIGAAILFWIASIFTKREHVFPPDLLKLFFASMLGVLFNQGLFTIGLGMTSPVDASIITTSTPILTMIIAAIYLKEPITNKKVSGIFLGASGALLLIVSNQNTSGTTHNSNIWGDIVCLTAELSFALYLVLFKQLISRYSPITLMKWMFTYAAICIIPFSFQDITHLEWLSLEPNIWYGLSFILLGSTFVSYLLAPTGQRYLRPTVVSMYCYVQPIVASCVAVYWGMDSFNLLKIIAVICVFSGVFLVTRSKSRADMEAAV